MTSTTTRPHRPDQRPTDGGFTIIELLVAVIIIGILAGIAIPAYLNQRSTAHGASVESDLRNIAAEIETQADGLDGALYRSSGAYAVVDAAGHGVAVTLSGGTGWGIKGTANSYCLAGWNPDSGHTAADPLYYDSAAGGLGKSGGACDGTPPTMSAPVIGGTGGNAPVTTGKNLLADSGFQNVPQSRLYVSSMGSTAQYVSQLSAYWGFYDVPSPAGTRALRAITSNATSSQGVIIYQRPDLTTGGSQIVLGQQYTVSTWVRAPEGQAMTLIARVTDANRAWRGESPKGFTATGQWQRVSHTVTGTATTAGNYLALQVQVASPYPAAGAKFEIAGPQIEQGGTATEYEQSAP